MLHSAVLDVPRTNNRPVDVDAVLSPPTSKIKHKPEGLAFGDSDSDSHFLST
jgi:hypothetical protein